MKPQPPATPRQTLSGDFPRRGGELAPDVFRLCVLRALARTGLSEGQKADALGVGASTWSKQKTGTDGHRLSVQRLDQLPPAEKAVFLDALLEELARELGRTVIHRAGPLKAIATMALALSDAVDQLAASASLDNGVPIAAPPASMSALPFPDRRQQPDRRRA